jgi:hypothetical protein
MRRHALAFSLLGLFGGLLLTGVILGIVAWTGSDAREWLATHFAQVRRNPRAYVTAAKGNAERAEAYAAIGASSGEDLPWLMSSRGGGGFSEFRTTRCLNATLTGPKGERPIAILVLDHTRDGTVRRSIEALSVRRECKCPRYGGCRLQ